MKEFSQNKKLSLCSSALCFFLLSIMQMNCPAQDIQNLDPPQDLECLVDKANLVHSEHAKKIRSRGKTTPRKIQRLQSLSLPSIKYRIMWMKA